MAFMQVKEIQINFNLISLHMLCSKRKRSFCSDEIYGRLCLTVRS